MTPECNRRILAIDDTPSIHADFRKILAHKSPAPDLDAAETTLFGQPVQPAGMGFEFDSALSGRDGVAMVEAALRSGRPYALAFVDMRMPAGWDGVETIERLWRIDPQLQVVICTAYSDYPWEEVMARLDVRDRLLVVKKPFDVVEVSQLARTLTAKWDATRQAASQIEGLARAVEALRESHRQLETLAHSLSHDLRAPLTAMRSFSQLLARELDGSVDGKARHYLERISANAAVGERLINDLLVLDGVSRAELEREEVDLAVVARGVLEELHEADREREVVVIVEDGLRAQVDRNLAHIALRHLLGNAWKFTARTPPARIEVGRRTAESGETEFYVRDNGRGFDMAYAGTLFQRPQRLHQDSRLTGSGMGLVVAGRIIARHGGRIWAEALPDGGATFRFTLPPPARTMGCVGQTAQGAGAAADQDLPARL